MVKLVVWDLLTIPLGNNPLNIFVDLRNPNHPGPKPLIYHCVTQKERKRQLTIGLLDFMFEPSKSEKKVVESPYKR